MKYARCKIKNIAIPNVIKTDYSYSEYIELTDSLPNDCIRLSPFVNCWCTLYCKECFDL